MLCVALGTFSVGHTDDSKPNFMVVLYKERSYGQPYHSFQVNNYNYRYTFNDCFDKLASSSIIDAPYEACLCFNTNTSGKGLTRCIKGPISCPKLQSYGIGDMIKAISVFKDTDPQCITKMHNATEELVARVVNTC